MAPQVFFQARYHSCHPTKNFKALTSTGKITYHWTSDRRGIAAFMMMMISKVYDLIIFTGTTLASVGISYCHVSVCPSQVVVLLKRYMWDHANNAT